MRTEEVHSVVLGSGPSGLASAYTLAKSGVKTVLLERDKVCGGLMRSIHHGDFVVDVGRKELYNRLAKVDTFWTGILGDDYRPYPHRGGVLYDGHIMDQAPNFQGFRRGMPWGMFFGCFFDFAMAQAFSRGSKAKTLEEYFYKKRGRSLTKIFSQGFQEKLIGRSWKDIPIPESDNSDDGGGFVQTLKGLLVRTFSSKEVNTFKGSWRHPAKGTGQICDRLEAGIRQAGGQIYNSVKVTGMDSGDGVITSVTAEIGGETVVFKTKNVVSSIPLEFLVQMLLQRKLDSEMGKSSSPFRKKVVVLVYLFLDEEPQFPHGWLIVTCPKTRIGRITNYTGFNGDMVPKGKTCLCCEYYCFDEDPMLKMTDKEFADLALKECNEFKLVHKEKCSDTKVLRFPGADASQNRHNWMSKIRLGLLADLKPFKNLYYINRTDLDIATLAGIESAEAIISGNRSEFDRHIDPTQIGIRSEKKAFEFKKPPGVET